MFDTKVARRPVLNILSAIVLAAVATGCGSPRTALSPTSSAGQPTDPPIVSTVTSLPPAASVPQTKSEPATLIFHNGTILTMDEDQPTAQAIALAGDKVLAVGSNHEILALRDSSTQVIDLQGHTLMPGFIDTHTHIFNEARNNAEIGTIENAQQVLLQNGITTIANLYTTREFLAEMRAIEASGELRVRTSMYLSYTTNCGDVLGDWYKDFAPTLEPGEMLRIAGVKVFTDGGSCKLPAVSFDHPEWGQGDLFFTQERMNTIVSDINQAGYQVAIHAIGDRAVEQALNAIEFALDGGPNTLRHRIEHNTIVRPDLQARYQEIGVVASVIGNIWSCNMTFDPPESRAWYFPYRGMLDASPKAHFAWHADYPWSSQNPLFHLYSLVSPNEIAGDRTECADPPGLNKTITVDEALPMMTIEGAYILHRDDEVGSLTKGKYADLIILSKDPTDDVNAIRNIQVWMTMVGGHVEWCAPGRAEFCPGAAAAPLVDEGPIAEPVRIRIQITTTSDWATLTLYSGGTLINHEGVSASAETTNHGANGNLLFINQTIERANSGASVDLVVDATLSDAHTAGQLEFVIESGAIGDTTVKLFNYLQDSPVEVTSVMSNDMSKSFNMPVEKFISP